MTLLEAAANRMTGGKITQLTEQAEQLQETSQQQQHMITLLQESMRTLELALQASDWRLLTMQSEREFSRPGLKIITDLARIMRLKNPVIKRGVEIQKLYVFAQGLTIKAADATINEVIQAFLDDERNKAELTTHQARGEKETDLQQDGNLFFRFFINQQTGRVRIRTIDPNEIVDIICNPEDKKEPWFYKRTYTRQELNGSTTSITEFYPDWHYNPISKVAQQVPGADGGRIVWDTPIYHVAVNRVGRWGVCEFYDAQDWALAYKTFLEQLASVWQALARYAYKLTTKGGKRGVAAAKTKLATTLSTNAEETNPPPVPGSTWLQSEGVDMQPFRTQGATMSADDGRRILLMAISTFGFPETFYGDASVGSLATAKSLDRPTELKITDRQTLWADIHRNILQFVLLWAAKAPAGPLRSMGRYQRERDMNEFIELIDWGNNDATLVIEFPPIIEEDVPKLVAALIDATTLKGRGEGIPARKAVEKLITFFGFTDTDEIMAMWDEAQEERQARAEQMAAQLGGGQNDDNTQDDEGKDAKDANDNNDDQMTPAEERAIFRQQVEGLFTELREAFHVNGKQ